MSCTASIARRDKPIFRAARWSCDEPRPASKGTTGRPAIPWCSRDRTTDRSTACTSSTIRQTGRVQLTISASVSKVIAGGAVACPRVPPTWARLPAPIDPSLDCVRRVASSMARALRIGHRILGAEVIPMHKHHQGDASRRTDRVMDTGVSCPLVPALLQCRQQGGLARPRRALEQACCTPCRLTLAGPVQGLGAEPLDLVDLGTTPAKEPCLIPIVQAGERRKARKVRGAIRSTVHNRGIIARGDRRRAWYRLCRQISRGLIRACVSMPFPRAGRCEHQRSQVRPFRTGA